MLRLMTACRVPLATDGPLRDSSGNLLRISPQELLRGPTMPRVELFLLQFSQDHEVTVEEVDIMIQAYMGLLSQEPTLARALKSRAQIIIQRFGTPDAVKLAKEAGLLDK